MADLNVSLILRLVDKATAPARAVMRVIDRMGGEGIMRQAARVQRGSVMMASGLGTVAGTATRAVGVLGDYRTILAGIGVGAIAGGFIRTAAEFENFNVQLTNLEGSSAAAARAMDWIENFATRTPLQVEETVSAYARLKAFGIDPMNGTLQALTDTMAATGGGTEQLNGMVLAIGQSWTKGKLQGEEALQLLERGVPVYDLLAKKLGKTTEEIVAMQGAGELGRDEIALLIEAMGEANLGAAEDMSKTWDGIISNLWDYWSKFQRLVMKSGLFVYLKDKLIGLLDMLNRMAANGDLQRWAEGLAASVMTGLEAIWEFGAGVVAVWQEVAPWISWAADKVGGFGNAIGILIGLRYAAPLLALAGAFLKIGAGALWAGSFALPVLAWALRSVWVAATPLLLALRWVSVALMFVARAAMTTALFFIRFLLVALHGVARVAWTMAAGALSVLAFALRMVGGAALFLARSALAVLVGSITMVGRAVLALSRALMINPIILILSAIAGMAYVIYDSWSGIVAYFTEKIGRVAAAFDTGLLNGVLKLLSEFNPFTLMYDAATELFTYITGWTFADVRAGIASAFGIDPFTALYNAAERFFIYVTGWSFAEVTTAITSAFEIDFYAIGVKMISDLWLGLQSMFGTIKAGMSDFFASITPAWMKGVGGPGSIGTEGTTGGMAGAMGDDGAAFAGQEDGARSTGGPVRAGGIYRWQENGEEFFRPNTDGAVINARGSRALRAGAGRTTNVNLGGIVINAAPGQSPQAIARAAYNEFERRLNSGSMALHDGGDYDV